MKKIAIVNCGTGNLLSVQKALAHLGVEGNITTDRETITSADSVILPGVGAWDPAISYLRQNGLEEALHGFVKTGKPFLGICLGAQLLHETSEEGKQKGLGWIPGEVKLFKPKDVAMKVKTIYVVLAHRRCELDIIRSRCRDVRRIFWREII